MKPERVTSFKTGGACDSVFALLIENAEPFRINVGGRNAGPGSGRTTTSQYRLGQDGDGLKVDADSTGCLLYTSPSPRD